jgi:16S rRNA (adenine(1408)-N(1))-methyltransferase
MKVFSGKETADLDAVAVREIARRYGGVLVDLGAGEGEFVLATARRRPDLLCIGIDAEARTLAKASGRALRKPSRGGAPNALFALGIMESLPAELDGLADHVTIILPWGSLLRAVVTGEPRFLQGVMRLARPGGLLEMLVAYTAQYEPHMMAELSLPHLGSEHVTQVMTPGYAQAGARLTDHRALDNASARRMHTGWGRTLAWGRPREFHYLAARLGSGDVGREAPPLLLVADEPPLPDAPPAVRFTAWGHPNVRAGHRVSIEFIRDEDLTEQGDCIVAVRADYDPAQLEPLRACRKLRVVLRVGEVEDSFTCGVNADFECEREIIFRKSAHSSPRTLGLHASKSAWQLRRDLIERLRVPGTRIEVAIHPVKMRQTRQT